MPTPTELRAEIIDDPGGLGYAASWTVGDDSSVAAIINAPTRPGAVPIEVLASYCVTRGITGTVLALDSLSIGQTISPGVTMTLEIKALLKSILTVIQIDYRLTSAEMNNPATGQMLDGAKALGIITSAQYAEILALANNRYSRAQELWGAGASISDADVARARREG